MEEAHGVGERILDEHALGIAGDEIFDGRACVVGEQDGGLVVAEIGDEELAVGAPKGTRLLFVAAWRADKESWIGYKLHLDVADGDIPISGLLTSASLHDSQAAIPLAKHLTPTTPRTAELRPEIANA